MNQITLSIKDNKILVDAGDYDNVDLASILGQAFVGSIKNMGTLNQVLELVADWYQRDTDITVHE